MSKNLKNIVISLTVTIFCSAVFLFVLYLVKELKLTYILIVIFASIIVGLIVYINLLIFTKQITRLSSSLDENTDKLEKEKEELQNTVNTKQSTLDSLNNQASSTSQSTLTLTSGTYAVGENIKAGKYTIMGSGSIAISSSGKARVNSNLTADGKDYVLNDDETIKIKGKAQFIPIK